MIRKIFNFLLTCLLINFSFYYTNIVSDYLKNKDPIMIKIKNIKNKYYESPINATILNHTIIPGISGYQVDEEKSYFNMKKIENYQESMLVFQKIKPDISLSNYYHYYIISGNKTKKNISILVNINNISLINKIENELEEEINYILSIQFIKNNQEYCYTTNIDEVNNCESYEIHTIVPKVITSDYYYQTYIKLENGGMYYYHITSNKNINDLKLLISGIKSLGFNIVSIDELIKE